MAEETAPNDRDRSKSGIGTDEANLLWDEYKYRHDLIWRHLIRSTVAVVALITIAYSTSFDEDELLFAIAAFLAVLYTSFSLVVLHSELSLYEKVKALHRQRQNALYQLHMETKSLPTALVGRFSSRARFYLFSLLILAVVAAISQIVPALAP